MGVHITDAGGRTLAVSCDMTFSSLACHAPAMAGLLLDILYCAHQGENLWELMPRVRKQLEGVLCGATGAIRNWGDLFDQYAQFKERRVNEQDGNHHA